MKCIIFDAEGVIIDTEPLWDKSQSILLKKFGVEYNRQEIKKLLAGNSFINGTRILMKYCNASESLNSFSKKREKIIASLFKKELKFVYGFKKFYSEVKNKCALCVATSLNKKMLSLAIDKLDLASYFDNIFSIEDAGGIPKPYPSIFLYAARKMDFNPKDCIVIEDSPNGISAAKKAEMYCIGITTTFSKKDLKGADTIVNSFSEIEIRGLLK